MYSYILDDQLRLMPVGGVGELYLGGVGLARGYHGRPDLTAERFIPDPFSQEHPCSAGTQVNTRAGARLYRTGDLARYRADGAIKFVGRVDQQVKLRGFRIELGEIEVALRQYGAIRDALVIVREDRPDDKRLVAYVVEEVGSQAQESTAKRLRCQTDQMRAFLQARLPEYMIPSALVVLETLPLTPNGKIDRSALPVPDMSPSDDCAYAAPTTAIEETLTRVWTEILHVKRVGIHDNFFALGGHSVLAMQVLAQVQQIYKVIVPIMQIFNEPTIAQLAVTIDGLQKSNKEPLRGKLVPIPRQAHRV
jgi:hypothetical protein